MNKPDVTVYLTDIFIQSENIIAATKRMDYEEFLNDPLYHSGIIRFFEIIGEAAKHIPEDYRKNHQEIPWKKIAGFRDRLIHGYAEVNLKYVWEIVGNDVPDLYIQIKSLLNE